MFVFVWIRGTVVRFRYDQFMRLGWKVLLPASLAWIVILTIVKFLDAFTRYQFNSVAVPLLSWVAVLFVIIWFWPVKEPEEPGPSEPVEIDPFADGFPVPPLPGQVLPPSPRATGKAEAMVSSEAPVKEEQ
jgi:NADH-quinone oxidoreductase subunit H